MRSVAVAVLLLMVACGSDGKDGQPCTVTDTATGATLTCPDGTSVTMSDGAAGTNGVDGVDGIDGTDGTDNHVAAGFLCLGDLDTAALSFVYRAVELESGDVFVYGAIKGDAFETGASAFFSAQQVGAPLAAVSLTYDIYGAGTAGWWSLELNRVSGIAVIQYHDLEMGGSGVATWTMPASACTVQTY